jgi:hypothetical protein
MNAPTPRPYAQIETTSIACAAKSALIAPGEGLDRAQPVSRTTQSNGSYFVDKGINPE